MIEKCIEQKRNTDNVLIEERVYENRDYSRREGLSPLRGVPTLVKERVRDSENSNWMQKEWKIVDKNRILIRTSEYENDFLVKEKVLEDELWHFKHWTIDGILVEEKWENKDGKLCGKHTSWFCINKKNFEVEYSNGKRNGESISYYTSGEKSMVKEYRDGVLIKERIHYLIDNKITWKCKKWDGETLVEKWSENESGEKVGTRTMWWDNGKKRQEVEYSNGERDGESIDWRHSGEKSMINGYRDGFLIKQCRRRIVDTKIIWECKKWEVGTLVEKWSENESGKNIGTHTVWYNDGEKKSENEYDDSGKFHGTCSEWNKVYGEKMLEKKFEHGILIVHKKIVDTIVVNGVKLSPRREGLFPQFEGRVWKCQKWIRKNYNIDDPFTQIEKSWYEKKFSNGVKRIGEYKELWADGMVHLKCNYNLLGELDGWCENYYDNGKPNCKNFYKNGKLEGESRTWWRNGRPWITCYYKDGKLHGNCESWTKDGTSVTIVEYKDDAAVEINVKKDVTTMEVSKPVDLDNLEKDSKIEITKPIDSTLEKTRIELLQEIKDAISFMREYKSCVLEERYGIEKLWDLYYRVISVKAESFLKTLEE